MTHEVDQITSKMRQSGFSAETVDSARQTLAFGEALRRDALELSPEARAAYQRAKSAALPERVEANRREVERRRLGRRLAVRAGIGGLAVLGAATCASAHHEAAAIVCVLIALGAGVALTRLR